MAETRRLLRDGLRLWGVPALVDTTELLATELLTNALQYTGGGAVLTVTLSPGPDHRLRVEVRGLAGRPRPAAVPRQQAGAEQGTSGRGLLLVEALADAWGVQTRGGRQGGVVRTEGDSGVTAARTPPVWRTSSPRSRRRPSCAGCSAELPLQVLEFALQRVQPGHRQRVVLGRQVDRPRSLRGRLGCERVGHRGRRRLSRGPGLLAHRLQRRTGPQRQFAGREFRRRAYGRLRGAPGRRLPRSPRAAPPGVRPGRRRAARSGPAG